MLFVSCLHSGGVVNKIAEVVKYIGVNEMYIDSIVHDSAVLLNPCNSTSKLKKTMQLVSNSAY